jgi:type II secretory pathway pseudopilin PulG
MNQSTLISRAVAVGPGGRHGGFALIEALISLLVVAFGMLAIGAFQFTLSRASDVAKQRTEATRIAQSDIDRARSFVSRGADGTPGDWRLTYTEDLAVGTSPVTNITGPMTNTTFRRQVVISQPTLPVPAGGESYRWVNVTVLWADRTGVDQSVSLSTAVSDGESSSLGSLASGGSAATTLRPRNRNINVPYPAVNLAGGLTSAFAPPPGSTIFVFDNNTGDVTQFCRPTPYAISAITGTGTTATATTAVTHPFTTGTVLTIVGATPAGYNGQVTVTGVAPGISFDYTVASGLTSPATLSGATATPVVTLTEGIDLSTTGLTCTTYSTPAYLVSGYVRFKTQGAAATAANIDDPNDLRDDTRPLADTVYNSATDTFTSQPVTITSTSTGHAPAGYECYAQRQLTVRNNNPPSGSPSDITIAEGAPVPSGYSSTNVPRFIAYTCVVTPAAGPTPPIWSGEITLNPLGWTFGESGTLGATTGTGRLCRFSSDYNRNATLSNSEHPRFYRQVRGTLDNQNYLVVNGGDNCPTDVASDPANANYIDTNAPQHQPNPVLSFRCLNTACTGANRDTNFETSPTNPAAAIPME